MAVILSILICSLALGQALTEGQLKEQISLLAEIRMLKMELQEKDQQISRLEQQLESEKHKVELYKKMYSNRSSAASSSSTKKIDKKTRKEMEQKRQEFAQQMKEKQARERILRSRAQSRAQKELGRLDYMKFDSFYNRYNPRYAGYPRYPVIYSGSPNGRYAHPESFYYNGW